MGNSGLSDIGVLNVNAQMQDRLDRETVVNRFAETPRRILLYKMSLSQIERIGLG